MSRRRTVTHRGRCEKCGATHSTLSWQEAGINAATGESIGHMRASCLDCGFHWMVDTLDNKR